MEEPDVGSIEQQGGIDQLTQEQVAISLDVGGAADLPPRGAVAGDGRRGHEATGRLGEPLDSGAPWRANGPPASPTRR